MQLKNYFRVNTSRYTKEKAFDVVRPASLNEPKDNAVMFVSEGYMQYADALLRCENCLVFWPESIPVPEEIAARLCISVNTVRNHIQHMLEKTGYKNRIDLAVNAKALGVVVHEDDRTENRPQRGGHRI